MYRPSLADKRPSVALTGGEHISKQRPQATLKQDQQDRCWLLRRRPQRFVRARRAAPRKHRSPLRRHANTNRDKPRPAPLKARIKPRQAQAQHRSAEMRPRHNVASHGHSAQPLCTRLLARSICYVPRAHTIAHFIPTRQYTLCQLPCIFMSCKNDTAVHTDTYAYPHR